MKRTWSCWLLVAISVPASGQLPVDTCPPAPLIQSFPFILNAETTVGAVDNYNLASAGTCAGGGTQVPGTGNGPDVVLHFVTAKSCTLSINLFPFAGIDLALYAVTNCAALASTCSRVSDASAAGGGEVLNFTVSPLVDYWVIVDGSSGGSGGYGFNIVENPPGQGCLGIFVDGFERGSTANWSVTVG